jgi:hypothetical protein
MRFSACVLLCSAGVAVNAQKSPEVPRCCFEIAPNLHLDITKIDAQRYHIDFENEKVRVVRTRLKPDETGAMHDDSEGMIVCPSECHLRFTRTDGKVQDVHLAAGESRWVYDDTRSEKNLSTRPVEFLYIELKKKA